MGSSGKKRAMLGKGLSCRTEDESGPTMAKGIASVKIAVGLSEVLAAPKGGLEKEKEGGTKGKSPRLPIQNFLEEKCSK